MRTELRLIHHLARTGGTLISKCIASMQGINLLSEIHPLGTHVFNPALQASRWFQLLDEQTASSLPLQSEDDFVEAIFTINEKAIANDTTLVIRDWTHLDYHGAPYVDQPAFELSTARVLAKQFQLSQVFTLRHPVHQFTSLNRLRVLKQPFSVADFMQGYLAFTRLALDGDWYRFEDFLQDPDRVLQQICTSLDLTYDATWVDRWAEYKFITGDGSNLKSINPGQAADRTFERSLLAEFEKNDDYQQAIQLLDYAHPRASISVRAVKPGTEIKEASAEELFARAYRETEAQNWAGAAEQYRRLLKNYPLHEWGLNNLGFALIQLGKHDEARRVLLLAEENYPENFRVLANLVLSLNESGRKYETIPYLRRLVQLQPDNKQQNFNLAGVLQSSGRAAESLHYYRRTLEIDPNYQAAIINYLLALNYTPGLEPEFILDEHLRLLQTWNALEREDIQVPLAPGEKIRIGYVSNDYSTHPVGKIMASIIEAHDRSRFEIFCYYNHDVDDYWTKKISQAADHFTHCNNLANRAFERLVREDHIHVMVDLGGHMGGKNRLKSFARGLAPVQMTFLGYPCTTGVNAVDYRITDHFADPPALAEKLHTEELMLLERGFLCYEPLVEIAPTPTPAAENGFITYGSFNNPSKIADMVLRTWANILKQTPGSQLKVKYGRAFESEVLREHWRAVFAEEGVDTGRIDFLPVAPTLKEHFEVMQAVDLALDPFPYQGTMTTLETLSTGTPILTLQGTSSVRRASSALLARIGRHELITETTQDYVSQAVTLTADTDALSELRAATHRDFLASDICDVEGFVRELETAYTNTLETRIPAASQETMNNQTDTTRNMLADLMSSHYQIDNVVEPLRETFEQSIRDRLDVVDWEIEGYTDPDRQRDLSVKFRWGHNHDFGSFQLNGQMGNRHIQILAEFIDHFGLPADLSGKKVLDIGAWTGGTSLLMAAMGAEVVALEEVRKYADTINFLAEAFGLDNLRSEAISLYDLEAEDEFDIVIYSGVVYHVTDPILSLRILFNALKDNGRIFVETFGTGDGPRGSAVAVVEGPKHIGSGTKEALNRGGWNYFIPSPAALRTWVDAVGFEEIQVGQLDAQRRIKCSATRVQHYDMIRAGLSRVGIR